MTTLLLYAFKYPHLNVAFEVWCSLYSLLLRRLSVPCNFGRYLEFSITNTIVYHLQYSEPAWSLAVLIISFPKTRLPPYHSLSSYKIPNNLWSEPPPVSIIYEEKEHAASHNSTLSVFFMWNFTTCFGLRGRYWIYPVFRLIGHILNLTHASCKRTSSVSNILFLCTLFSFRIL
jgi:hypothetical protein